MKRTFLIILAALPVVAGFGALGYVIMENRSLKADITAFTEPSMDARTECVRDSVSAYRLMEARQHGIPRGEEARQYAHWKMAFREAVPGSRSYRFFQTIEEEVWSYSREIDPVEQKRVADTYSDIKGEECLKRYAPRMIHPKIGSDDICGPDRRELCDAIPAAQVGQDLCDPMREVTLRAGHHINATRDTIRVLAPSFRRDIAANNMNEQDVEAAVFLQEASGITLRELEIAVGKLTLAARSMCDFK